jgi:L-lactate dehydrogenase complex protein LldG
MSSQEAFLSRVRRALHKERLPEAAHQPLFFDDPQLQKKAASLRERLRTQRPALITQLQEQLTAVGGVVTCASSSAEAVTYISRLAQEKRASLIVCWQSEILRALEVGTILQQQGITVQVTAPPQEEGQSPVPEAEFAETRRLMRDLSARADIGLSGVDFAIAETGTLVLAAQPGHMRGVSLLPPVHIAVVRAEQIVATMADYLLLLRAAGPEVQQRLTSCVSFITGPSRTGDIELTLVVGVHGPGELHLVILNEPPHSEVIANRVRL